MHIQPTAPSFNTTPTQTSSSETQRSSSKPERLDQVLAGLPELAALNKKASINPSNAIAPSRLQPVALEQAQSLLRPFVDVVIALQRTQIELREEHSQTQKSRINSQLNQAERVHAERQKAIAKAEKAARKAKKWLGLGKLLGKIIDAVMKAITTLMPVQGKAAHMLSNAAGMLLLNGPWLAKGLQKAGILNEKQAQLLGQALQLTGALLSADMAQTSALGATSSLVQTSHALTPNPSTLLGSHTPALLELSRMVSEGIGSTVALHYQDKAQDARFDAHEKGLDLQGIMQWTQDALEQLDSSLQRFENIGSSLQDMKQVHQRMRQEALQQLR